MLTKAEGRAVTSLHDKKERDRLGIFVVEGDKLVREALAMRLPVRCVYGEAGWIRTLSDDLARAASRIVEVRPTELRRLSAQVTPHGGLAVLEKPRPTIAWAAVESNLVLVLDAVQDPSNVGSLLRVAAWFGIEDVVAAPAGADAYNPKAVQASMGAVFRVRVHSIDPASFVRSARDRGLPALAATLDGESVYSVELPTRGLLVLGNESNGISPDVLALASRRVTIPAWGAAGPGRDSLNVATAAAVLCAELRRRATSPESPGHARERD